MKGAVISDLHIFSGRNRPLTDLHKLVEKENDLKLLILNGDIFDFNWQQNNTVEIACERAKCILEELCTKYIDIHFIYISGNHDQEAKFIPELEKLDKVLSNFTWKSSFLKLDNKLFHHGDRFFSQDIARQYQHREKVATKFLYNAYKYLTAIGINRLAEIPLKPQFICPFIEKRWQKFFDDHSIREVFFGHTHVPFVDFHFGKRIYHNTGTFISNQKFHFITFNWENFYV